MSSISFPSELHEHEHTPFYAPPAFDGSAPASGFQMNPLSAHPPRTPRPSTFGGGGGGGMGMGREEDGGVSDESEEELDEENERVRAVERGVRAHDVWREMLVTSNGRDKAFKLMQYSIRVYLLFHSKLLRGGKSPFEQELVRRLTAARSGFSFTRKMLILFNWLTPLSQITAQQAVPFSSSPSSLVAHTLPSALPTLPFPPTPTPALKPTPTPLLSHPFLLALLRAPPPVLLDLASGLSDDLHTLSKLGLIGRRAGERAGRVADWCWFFGTLVGLVENGVEMGVVGGLVREVESRAYTESLAGATQKSRPRASAQDEKELQRLRRKSYWLQVGRAKLVADLVFVVYDLLRIKRWSESVHSFAGLVSGVLSAAKLFDKHKTALVKGLVGGGV
ncbi:hypothetical protein BV22DRAFT_1074783 [Leucogyrophana mollusca]|uniref:Uncharacterized protein n=1 Tax=Leucogyrophana mollusca TaxID=85980 RepID=A0ACB8B219_9AGAM|nr:hypothetical protein BV22DRAFT_1074783 [Leucogyrophana mollusca]